MANKGHKAVRLLIEETLGTVDDSVRFAYATDSDFNSIGIREDKRVQLDPIKQSLEYTEGSFNLTKTYQIGMVFYQLDDPEGAEEKTAQILDQMDELSDKFIQKLNDVLLDQDDDIAITTATIELTSIVKEPAIKATVDVCTGWILNFNVIAPDDFDYCSLYDE